MTEKRLVVTLSDTEKIIPVIRRLTGIKTFPNGPGVLKANSRQYAWSDSWKEDIELELGRPIAVIRGETGYIYFDVR